MATDGLRIVSCPDFVRYDAAGGFDKDAMRACLRAIAAACADAGIRHALLDVRDITDAPSIAQLFWIGQELPELGFSRLDRVAIVFIDHGQGRASFFATTARVRGVNLREFTEFDLALDWLAASAPVHRGRGTEEP